ncbi:hypothetical protein ABRY23_06955 [Melioribacteraceae bacterium 4301-Me]|uniref:hypothetical protein n=1 Tax=Pyranulibacter aquaticus TaxID=3163344 RepID=UPI003594E00C
MNNKTLALFTLIFFTIILSSCNNVTNYDDIAPLPPKNIKTITGDNRVDIYWDPSPSTDVAGYNVYYSYSYNGKYTLIGSTKETYFIDSEARNGNTYYYAVTAYDFNGNESQLSDDIVYDTPRPEGFNQVVFDYLQFPDQSAYNFSSFSVVPYNSQNADFFFENYNGTYYIDVWKDSDIQDMGITKDIYDVDYAPLTGWVPLVEGENIKYAEAKIGHTYVIWTWDNHYAKIRVKEITSQRMVFDWAYQLVEGNRELKRADNPTTRKETYKIVIRKR